MPHTVACAERYFQEFGYRVEAKIDSPAMATKSLIASASGDERVSAVFVTNSRYRITLIPNDNNRATSTKRLPKWCSARRHLLHLYKWDLRSRYAHCGFGNTKRDNHEGGASIE
jgi:hypothetical protein